MKRMLAPLPPPTVDELLEPSGVSFGSAPSLGVFSAETPFANARRSFLRDRWDDIVTRAGVGRGNDSSLAGRLSLFAESDARVAYRQAAFLERQQKEGLHRFGASNRGAIPSNTDSQSQFETERPDLAVLDDSWHRWLSP